MNTTYYSYFLPGLFSDGTCWYGVPALIFQVKKKIICFFPSKEKNYL